jgi:hypothetical protein
MVTNQSATSAVRPADFVLGDRKLSEYTRAELAVLADILESDIASIELSDATDGGKDPIRNQLANRIVIQMREQLSAVYLVFFEKGGATVKEPG